MERRNGWYSQIIIKCRRYSEVDKYGKEGMSEMYSQAKMYDTEEGSKQNFTSQSVKHRRNFKAGLEKPMRVTQGVSKRTDA
jgi:hypothetical protein